MRYINLRLLEIAFKNNSGSCRPLKQEVSNIFKELELSEDEGNKIYHNSEVEDYLAFLEEKLSEYLTRKAMYYEIPNDFLKQYFALEKQMINTISQSGDDNLMNVFIEWQEVRNKLNNIKFEYLMEFLTKNQI